MYEDNKEDHPEVLHNDHDNLTAEISRKAQTQTDQNQRQTDNVLHINLSNVHDIGSFI